MGKFFRHAGGEVGLRRDKDFAPVPPDATDIIDFDEATNRAIIDDYDRGCLAYTIVAGVLQKNKVPVPIVAESNERATKRELKDQIQGRLDECDATITIADATVVAAQTVIDGVDTATTVPQLRAMVKTLAQRQKQDAQELKSVARNQKRILRILKGLT